MDVDEREYAQFEGAPVDGTGEPEAADAPGQINLVSGDVEVATEEDLQRIIEQEGKVLEPEIAIAEQEGAPPPLGEESRTRGYIKNHLTNFNWRSDVANLVSRIQKQFPNQTYANTYYWHPPYSPPAITKRYDAVSVDFWGGGVSHGQYVGYRGKPIGTQLGQMCGRLSGTTRTRRTFPGSSGTARCGYAGAGGRDLPRDLPTLTRATTITSTSPTYEPELKRPTGPVTTCP